MVQVNNDLEIKLVSDLNMKLTQIQSQFSASFDEFKKTEKKEQDRSKIVKMLDISKPKTNPLETLRELKKVEPSIDVLKNAIQVFEKEQLLSDNHKISPQLAELKSRLNQFEEKYQESTSYLEQQSVKAVTKVTVEDLQNKYKLEKSKVKYNKDTATARRQYNLLCDSAINSSKDCTAYFAQMTAFNYDFKRDDVTKINPLPSYVTPESFDQFLQNDEVRKQFYKSIKVRQDDYSLLLSNYKGKRLHNFEDVLLTNYFRMETPQEKVEYVNKFPNILTKEVFEDYYAKIADKVDEISKEQASNLMIIESLNKKIDELEKKNYKNGDPERIINEEEIARLAEMRSGYKRVNRGLDEKKFESSAILIQVVIELKSPQEQEEFKHKYNKGMPKDALENYGGSLEGVVNGKSAEDAANYVKDLPDKINMATQKIAIMKDKLVGCTKAEKESLDDKIETETEKLAEYQRNLLKANIYLSETVKLTEKKLESFRDSFSEVFPKENKESNAAVAANELNSSSSNLAQSSAQLNAADLIKPQANANREVAKSQVVNTQNASSSPVISHSQLDKSQGSNRPNASDRLQNIAALKATNQTQDAAKLSGANEAAAVKADNDTKKSNAPGPFRAPALSSDLRNSSLNLNQSIRKGDLQSNAARGNAEVKNNTASLWQSQPIRQNWKDNHSAKPSGDTQKNTNSQQNTNSKLNAVASCPDKENQQPKNDSRQSIAGVQIRASQLIPKIQGDAKSNSQQIQNDAEANSQPSRSRGFNR